MSRLRRQLAPLVPTVAALFALCVVAPRAPLLFHTHAGGAHTHTHGDAELAAALAAALERDVAHEPAAPARDHRPSLRRDVGAPGGHYHQQPRFQRGVLPTAAFIAVAGPFVAVGADAVAPAPARAVCGARSRAPPRSLPS